MPLLNEVFPQFEGAPFNAAGVEFGEDLNDFHGRFKFFCRKGLLGRRVFSFSASFSASLYLVDLEKKYKRAYLAELYSDGFQIYCLAVKGRLF